MTQQETASGGEKYFGPVEREDTDIDAAVEESDFPIGRSGNGIIRIGMFGGKPTTGNPDAIEAPEDGGRGLGFVRTVAKAAQDIDNFSGDIRFPKEIEDAIYSGASHTDPFGAYRFTMFLGNMDHRRHNPVMGGLVNYFETDYEGRYDIRAIEFSFDDVAPAEKFRAIYPWGTRERELKSNDDLDNYDAPSPIRSLVRDLQETPLECRDYRPLTVTVHYYNSRSDRDGKYDREFQLEDFHGADEMAFIEKDRRTSAEKALDASTTKTEDTSISYQLSLTVDCETINELIEDEDKYNISTPEEAAQSLGQTHHNQNYSDSTHATVGVVKKKESEGEMTFTLAIQSHQR